ncbi:unnamed protein product [Acanthoscelides obtectus]|uniref:Uncharacterized protein n=1 Tax=Acanthoscelides obtectus TaxID=200917 RepID=A0A9P0L000_ACAOB|nr:unnamed protein product [Acanthoscelides obtectus]CAK1654586.1 hypothetical protein AOBTE_LOCUS18694 [Acanthoscelides obtectus]
MTKYIAKPLASMYFKSKVYKNNSNTIAKLKQEIRREITNIGPDLCHGVVENFSKRITSCHMSRGEYVKGRETPGVLGPRIYNKLPDEIKLCTSLKQFKICLSSRLLDKCSRNVYEFVNV